MELRRPAASHLLAPLTFRSGHRGGEGAGDQRATLDEVIGAVAQTGRDAYSKHDDTGQGGLTPPLVDR